MQFEPREIVSGWSADGRSLFAYRRGHIPAAVSRVDFATGKQEPWPEVAPTNPTGLVNQSPVRLAPEVGAYAYSYARNISDLFVIEGLR